MRKKKVRKITEGDITFYRFQGYAIGIFVLLVFSMCGIPFLGGFFAKYALLINLGAAHSSWDWIILFILYGSSLVSAFYYLRVIKKIIGDPKQLNLHVLERQPRILYFTGRFQDSKNLALNSCCFFIIFFALLNFCIFLYSYEILICIISYNIF